MTKKKKIKEKKKKNNNNNNVVKVILSRIRTSEVKICEGHEITS